MKLGKSGHPKQFAMSVYDFRPLNLEKVHTYPLKSRPSKVSIAEFAKPSGPGASVRQWIDSLPSILAANAFRAVISSLEAARRTKTPMVWGLGGHVIKCGLGPILIDLMRRGYITAVAMNGAALIHDFEIALV
ncbi:MAG TPA: hypothetical protein VMI06_19515, partial [Terriglobia bacterium]|nr:hypothetical protein [Terriglobia bacterium]